LKEGTVLAIKTVGAAKEGMLEIKREKQRVDAGMGMRRPAAAT